MLDVVTTAAPAVARLELRGPSGGPSVITPYDETVPLSDLPSGTYELQLATVWDLVPPEIILVCGSVSIVVAEPIPSLQPLGAGAAILLILVAACLRLRRQKVAYK